MRERSLILLLAALAPGVGQQVFLDGKLIRAKAKGELALYVEGLAGAPAVMGVSRHDGGDTVFEPRFPLRPEVPYRAVFRGPAGETSTILTLARKTDGPPARVEAVYPSTDLWPENQLKLYLHFSAPMSRGEAYRRVQLLDADGKVVEAPFLELEQELWDPDGKRLTILFDPGRVKRDLLPNREAGSPLVEGRTYTLLVDAGWPDADARPLASGYRKPIRVGPPDHEPVDPRKWRIRTPAPGSREALEIELGEPLDHALLARVVHVADRAGRELDGSVEIDRHETLWRFSPRDAWQAGDYWLRVERVLEDLAGNMVGRRFEVDVFEKVQERIARETESIPFHIGGR